MKHADMESVEAPAALEAAGFAEQGARWLDVCALEDIEPSGARVLRRAGGADIAIFRTAGDGVFALLDRCPHKGGPLSQGLVFEDRVACPLHDWQIGFADGEAIDLAAERFARCIAEHGPDSVAFYVSGQLLTEDYYVFNKLARGLIGTNNIDSNSRLCMSSAVVGYKSTLGADSVPCSYEDISLADHLLITGSNTAWAHPVIFRRIEDAKRANPDMTITVIDPRRTETAEFADLHLQIAPGSD